MGVASKLLGKLFGKTGGGSAGVDPFFGGEGALINAGADSLGHGAIKTFFLKAKEVVLRNKKKSAAGGAAGAAGLLGNGAPLLGSGLLPWVLGAAALGGAGLMFKDQIFGGGKEATAHQPHALTPTEAITQAQTELAPELAAPQMAVPAGGNVTAAYPAAVGMTGQAPQMAPPASSANWTARIAPAQATGSFVQRHAPAAQESFVREEQIRAEQAAALQVQQAM
jgi:hypothetical protein